MSIQAPRRIQAQLDDYQRDVAKLDDLRRRIEDMPFDQRSGNGFDHRMTRLQQKLAANPPPIEVRPGVWRRQPRGMRSETLAERKEGGFEPVRCEMIDGELNPATDLVPEYVIPSEVRIGDDGASLMDGRKWFEEAFKDVYPKPTYKVRGFKRIPMSEWSRLINDPEMPILEDHIEWILNQGSVGSCGAEGEVGSCDARADSMGFRPEGDPQDCAGQPYFLYKISSGGFDGGSNPSDNWALYKRLGCCRQAIRPRSRGWRAAHTQAELEDAARFKALEGVVFPYQDVELLGTFLFRGIPVGAGYSGHWWWAVKMLSRTQLKWCNSWGYNWGNNGLSTISVSQLRYMLIAKVNVKYAAQYSY